MSFSAGSGLYGAAVAGVAADEEEDSPGCLLEDEEDEEEGSAGGALCAARDRGAAKASASRIPAGQTAFMRPIRAGRRQKNPFAIMFQSAKNAMNRASF